MSTQEQAAKIFTDYALEKMMDLFHHHDHEVGSQLKKLNRRNIRSINQQTASPMS